MDPLWYKDAVIYEAHVRAFKDSNGDGIGDFRGLGEKLDYLQELGVTAVWLLPFYPSPGRDDGYDIADYRSINPDYGSMADFRRFLRAAHERGLKVITELVINHTSDQHPWFQRARRAKPGTVHRDFYVWSDDPEKYREARIIFKDFETSNWSWDPIAESYYWHRFYHHQPDLNFELPQVRREVFKAMDYWFDMGVDAMRLDAIPYLYEREGTNCENLPETHRFLKELRAHLDEKYEGRMLLAEANQWPEDSIAYFGDGDECHMSFHFPVMPRLFMSLRMEDRFPVIDIMEQTPPIPDNSQWAVFLRNHDELTLEMVTDEDRDYMYRVYASDRRARINLGIRRRLAPLLGNDRRRIELMNALLFSLPGTPVLYYGDEIGMGDNFYLGDRNGVRTPMQWSPDRNAGFSAANPQKLYLPVIIDPEYHYEALNVEAQQSNPSSLLWWMRRLIALRKRYQAFGRGTLEFLHPENHRVLAFLRRYRDERILIVANLSRFPQHVELDLSEFEGVAPVELFGGNRFPRIGELSYLLTIGPHSFYWFSLEPSRREQEEMVLTGPPTTYAEARRAVPTVTVEGGWQDCLSGKDREALEEVLPQTLQRRRWFGGKARTLRSVSIVAAVPVEVAERSISTCVAVLRVDYAEGEPETYVLPLAWAPGERGERALHDHPEAVVARLTGPGLGPDGHGVVYDAVHEPSFRQALLSAIDRRRSFKGREGAELTGLRGRVFRELAGDAEPTSHVSRAEQSNTSVIFGDRLILKLFRKMEPGENPDLEIGRFLTERTAFENLPPVAGALEFRHDGELRTAAILQGFVRNEGDAWEYTLDVLGRYFERVASNLRDGELREAPELPDSLLELSRLELTEEVGDVIGTYVNSAELLGQRTAELHRALSGTAAAEDPAFAPEPFSTLYQRSLYQSMRSMTSRIFKSLDQQVRRGEEGALAALSHEQRRRVGELAARRDELFGRYGALLDGKIEALRTRVHGDYHLGQVLYTGRDFVIIDYEGEPARPLSERRIKRSPLRDVAGMLRSFHYATHSSLLQAYERGLVGEEDRPVLEAWARLWRRAVGARFLRAYLATAAESEVDWLPDEERMEALLDVYLLEKAVYELGYELNNRPTWLPIPLAGIEDLLRTEARGDEEDA